MKGELCSQITTRGGMCKKRVVGGGACHIHSLVKKNSDKNGSCPLLVYKGTEKQRICGKCTHKLDLCYRHYIERHLWR